MSRIITEITPLSEKDCFYLVDRNKSNFDYPVHRHNEFELNFICNCSGATRIVGDSIETLGNYDLVLIGGGLEHTWEDGDGLRSGDIREITVQFSPSLLSDELLKKNQMGSVRELLDKAKEGVAFDMPAIMRVYSKLEALTEEQPGFIRLLRLLELLYVLSVSSEHRTLSSSSFANARVPSDSRRVQKIQDYINANYSKPLYLNELADMVGMTPTAFSRFFRSRTGRTLSDYIIDIRIGHASRRLVDSTMTSAEICFECGFNNISNFNRLFKKKKGCSPKTFRENYLKTKLIV